jgi:hypothetical protein
MSLQANQDDRAYAKKLVELSLKGLPYMWNEQAGLFCEIRMRKQNGVLVNCGLSVRYTLITLIGLHRTKAAGKAVSFDINAIAMPFINNVGLLDNLGDIGLLIWLSAQAFPEYLEKILSQIPLDTICNQYREGRDAKTMELSWLLTGLSYAAFASPVIKNTVQKTARALFEIIKNNYGGKGIFGHCNGKNRLNKFRCRMGSFADQVYPAYAFAAFSRAFDSKQASDVALACVKQICALQGSLGQWWWHYDAKTGKVVGRYPVYSVHQEAMAPMVLFEVGKHTQTDFTENIYRGLRWNSGANELNYDIVDFKNSIIWRCIFRPTLFERIEEISAMLGFAPPSKKPRKLKILHQGRPYCLGWLLYAFVNSTDHS